MASISSLGIGSGLPLNDLLDQLESAERKQLEPITIQQSSYKAKISALGKLESALDKLQQASAKLTEPESFQAVSSKVTGEGVTASAETSAVPGSYEVSVSQLAQAHSVASGQVSDTTSALGATGFTITQTSSDGETTSIDLALTGDESLEDLRDKINEQDGDVAASIINDGSGYRLTLNAKDTGAASAMTVAMSGADAATNDKFTFDPGAAAGSTTQMSETVTAQDAALKVNGISITSASNSVEEAIQGVTLDISALVDEAEPATVKVTRDEAGIQDTVQSFVDAYNSLQKTIDTLSSYDSDSGAAGTLLGDSTLRSVETQLRRVMSDSAGEGTFSMLSEIGVELSLEGTLEVDEDKLSDAVSNNLSGLQQFFQGSGEEGEGLAGKLDGALSTMLDDKGLIDSATTGYEDRIDALKERYTRTEETINNTVERYRQQFAQMDTLVSQMNSTMSYLTQQFDAMAAQTSQ
ncbi:flagellar filament capping protein FliD [Modicisalibacter radicis]|uniref:flagellar filament capping protein FliD n=1 Tax=Halomonas sp. EAR18 TaxID=2518972 RepID=UPI00109C180C|nr:flagellar filament capping protein FliD [Halomonas sp. EAR18]